MNLLHKLFHRGKGKRWCHKPSDLPWFDQPNALDHLDQRHKAENLSDGDYQLLRHWVTDGYFIIDAPIDPLLIDGMVYDLENIWTTTSPIDGLIIADVRLAPDAAPKSITHQELLSFPPEQRLQMKVWSHWRVHEFFRHSPNCQQIHDNPELIRVASLLMGRPANAEYTINFAYGSRQSLHQDSAVFHLFPPNYVAGLWLACEDIVSESGPLVFYPGSHKEPFFPDFDNYPQTNLKTCDKATTAHYQSYLENLAQKYERRQFLAKKGQALFWHGMLIHGGDAVIDSEKTRQSYVCHYVPPGMKQDHLIEGPFNW